MRCDSPHRVMVLIVWTGLAIPAAELGLVPSAALRSTSPPRLWPMGSQMGRDSQNTVIPNSYYRSSVWAILECSAYLEIRGCSLVPYRLFTVKTTRRQMGGNWAIMDSSGPHRLLKNHPPGPGKNKNSTGDWFSQETIHQFHHLFCTKSSFESVNGGFM